MTKAEEEALHQDLQEEYPIALVGDTPPSFDPDFKAWSGRYIVGLSFFYHVDFDIRMNDTLDVARAKVEAFFTNTES